MAGSLAVLVLFTSFRFVSAQTTGTVDLFGACSVDSDCLQDYCYGGVCAPVDGTQLINLPDGYHCNSRWQCLIGSYCYAPDQRIESFNVTTDMSICRPMLKEGTGQCDLSGTSCEQLNMNCEYVVPFKQAVCEYATKKLNDTCAPLECGKNLTCRRTNDTTTSYYGTCQAQYPGMPCDVEGECATGFCFHPRLLDPGYCVIGTGRNCTVTKPGPDPTCYSGVCGNDLKCTASPDNTYAANGYCTANADCSSVSPTAQCTNIRFCAEPNATLIALGKPVNEPAGATNIFSGTPSATGTGTGAGATGTGTTTKSSSGSASTKSSQADQAVVVGSWPMGLGLACLLFALGTFVLV
ncbi:hypothetical protein T439DRAFT_379458 [Meredithblackwellia eburnea MCA 4105]